MPIESRPARSDRKHPGREPGDERIRIGMVHGSTFDAADWQTNFPIHPDAAVRRGLDYLAIGDTHGFRFIPPDRKVPPTIYPGAPEPTAFDEQEPGYVAVVFINRRRVATVRPERVAQVDVGGGAGHVDGRVACAGRTRRSGQPRAAPDGAHGSERARVRRGGGAAGELQGTEARHARVGVLALDREALSWRPATVAEHCQDLPEVLRSAVRRLQEVAEQDPAQRPVAERALYHLFRTAKRKAS